ncbi:MAG: hypothetical protein LBQ12_04405 [Deltaproteobacteria bacterium]|jgi:hypothetical protein|nr:hypothetical protein [Deltaproteobacteria bacterium]
MKKMKSRGPEAATPSPSDALKVKGNPFELSAKLEAEKEAAVQNSRCQQASSQRDFLKGIYDRASNPQNASVGKEILDSNENAPAAGGRGPGIRQGIYEPPEPDPSLDPMEQLRNETAWFAGKLVPYFEGEKQIREGLEEAAADAGACLKFIGSPVSLGPGPLPFRMFSSDRGVTAVKAASLAEAGLFAEGRKPWPGTSGRISASS